MFCGKQTSNADWIESETNKDPHWISERRGEYEYKWEGNIEISFASSRAMTNPISLSEVC